MPYPKNKLKQVDAAAPIIPKSPVKTIVEPILITEIINIIPARYQ